MYPDLTGLLLAGGRSRRFGADKACVEVEGRAMIGRVYEALAPLCVEVLVSVADASTAYPLSGPARSVVDRAPDAGPLAGLDAGLAASATPWLLAIACDLPFLTTAALRLLVMARSEEVDAVVAVAPDGRMQPLCACYHRRVQPTVADQLAAGDRAMHALLDRLTVPTVQLSAEALRNVNTPRDLAGP